MPVSCERTRLQSAPFIRRTSIRTNPMEALRIKKLRPKPKSFTGHPIFFAERTRFELVVRITPYVGLANRWFQPLTHLSGHPRGARRVKRCANIASFCQTPKKCRQNFGNVPFLGAGGRYGTELPAGRISACGCPGSGVLARLAERTDDKIVASGGREVVVCCPKCLYL